MRIKPGGGSAKAQAPTQAQTQMVNHSTRAHALLSASGASRWINCPPSAKLEEAEGARKDTSFTREGTVAHELAELFVRYDVIKDVDKSGFEERLAELQTEELYGDEMIDHAQTYSDYYRVAFREAKARSKYAVVEVEQRLDLTEYIPDSFGTADGVIISDGTMEVIDYKYGKGVKVEPDWNPQGMLYALGALRKYDLVYDIHDVKITIIQPRIDHIKSFSISVADLKNWAETVAKPAAKLAFEGKGELKTGYWCKFCSVKAKCRAQFVENMEIAKADFSDPMLLSDSEIEEALNRADKIETWLKAIKEYAQQQSVENGKIWNGYKLVRADTKRKWADEDTAAKAILSEFPELSDDQLYNVKLKSITDVQKLVGKKGMEKLNEVIIKPVGAPTLVPIDDKRPAIGIEEAVRDFSE